MAKETIAAQTPSLQAPAQGGVKSPQLNGGKDPPPAVPRDLAAARQKAGEGEQKRLRGDYITAVQKFKEALAGITQAPEGAPLLNWCQAHLAAALGALGLVKQEGEETRVRARPLFQQVLQRNPEYAWAWAQYGEALRVDLRDRLSADPAAKAEFDALAVEALHALTRAIDLKPGYAWALAHRGALKVLCYWYYTTQNLPLHDLPEEFLTDTSSSRPVDTHLAASIQKDLEEALELEPGYSWARLFTAVYQNLFDQQEASTGTLTGLLSAGTSKNLPILTSLALSHAYGGNLEQAGRFADQLLAVDPESPTGFYVRAKALEGKTEDVERAAFESFRTRLEVAKDRIEAMLEDLQDGPPTLDELRTRRGASLDNLSIRIRMLGARQLTQKADTVPTPADLQWAAQTRAFGSRQRT